MVGNLALHEPDFLRLQESALNSDHIDCDIFLHEIKPGNDFLRAQDKHHLYDFHLRVVKK